MRRETWVLIAVGVGFPVLVVGGCQLITQASRPGTNATVIAGSLFLLLAALAGAAYAIKGPRR